MSLTSASSLISPPCHTRLSCSLEVCPFCPTGKAKVGSCPVLPADNIWNTPIDTLPVSPNSSMYVNTIGSVSPVHADFGSGDYNGGPIGIPYVKVAGTQTKYSATFLYWDESDSGPYAVPLNAPIEGGSNSTGDRHAIAQWIPTIASSTSCIGRSRRHRAGKPIQAQSTISTRTLCEPPAGPPRMRQVSRSCQAEYATTKSHLVRFVTQSDSPSRRPTARSCGRRAITRPASQIRNTRKYGCQLVSQFHCGGKFADRLYRREWIVFRSFLCSLSCNRSGDRYKQDHSYDKRIGFGDDCRAATSLDFDLTDFGDCADPANRAVHRDGAKHNE
jgi:hypothetical protein